MTDSSSSEAESSFEEYVRKLPKAELHLHIEGTLEPSMLMQLAEKHKVSLPYSTEEDVAAAYDFEDLQSFLDLYYLGASVLQDEQDFYDLMMAYLKRCRDEGIVRAEMMFDPQTHTDRGIAFDVVIKGFLTAMQEAADWVSTDLIMSFLRHLPENSAIATLEQAAPYRDQILAVGLDSSEKDFPPSMFQKVYSQAREQGYRLVAHAGEEGPPAYIIEALDLLKVERIDHGVRCLEDDALVERLALSNVPLTVCPLSNVRLCVFDDLSLHPLLEMMERGLNVCVNSDDPPYFGGYLMDNFVGLNEAIGLTVQQAETLAINSIRSSFASDKDKHRWLQGMQ